MLCVVCPNHVRLEIHPSKGWDRETGQQGTQLPTVDPRAVTFLSSKPERETLCLLWIFRCRALASPGDRPHLPCHLRSLLPLIPPAATPPGPRAPPCHPCSLCWSLRLCSPMALPIHYFTFSYKTFSKTALLKIKMQEVSHPPPLYPKRCRRSALPRGLPEISCACLGGDIPSMFSPSCLHECHVVHVYTLLRALFA